MNKTLCEVVVGLLLHLNVCHLQDDDDYRDHDHDVNDDHHGDNAKLEEAHLKLLFFAKIPEEGDKICAPRLEAAQVSL